MPTDAEGAAKVAGDGAHIGSGGTLHVDVHIEDPLPGAVGQHVQAGHLHLSRLQFHLHPAPCQVVGAFAIHLDRGDRRRHLLDPAAQRGERRFQVARGDPGCVGHRGHLTVGVIGGGSLTETYGGQVAFVVQGEMPQQPGGPVHTEDQHPGGHGVEGPGVPDPPGAEQPAEAPHHLV